MIQYGETRTMCPYYLREREKSITCEGAAKGSEVMFRYETREEKRKAQRICFSYPNNCPIALCNDEAIAREERREWAK